ncbi:family 1 glycosylhydrolase [Mycolicibacterium austroafricanum]|uniref:family 1 glycosylhydrolase n=1 Tax=Mycolicibacterium austroafricanum TaxID=39687 RepID=UPI001CA32527|nr:family 1 glycosylhydrolase [Mycolicibacterium austroafricanum]QZT62079.1 family 1 glycosylhydrolase [Mycolicibacterium austroafricanum]
MKSAQVVGRVGALAVALGVGAAVFTGSGVAWATEDAAGDTTAESEATTSEPVDGDTIEQVDDGDTVEHVDDGDTVEHVEPTDDDEAVEPDEQPVEPDDEEVDPGMEEVADTDGTPPRDGDGGLQVPAAPREDDAPPAQPDEDTEGAAPVGSSKTDSSGADSVGPAVDTVAVQRLTVEPTAVVSTTVVAPPEVPSWRPWPTAFDLRSAVTYVVDLATSFVDALLSPFAAGPPRPPADPSGWALLAWVRREFFNGTPAPVENPLPHTQSLTADGGVVITGNVGVEDPDGDALTYSVIGRPHNGGTVAVDADGNFVYRPMNAMAAVGGTDTFTVAVSDEQDGLHVHGLFGWLQFVPILGNLLNPGGGHGRTVTITVTVAPVDGIDLSLPDDFRWGVAHSGFQAEGGPGSPVDTRSDWYRWVHDPINRLLGLVKGVPEDGPGAYVSYEGDAALARDELGMNTFRMGIEWSRIFPESTAGVDISDEDGVLSLADLQALDELADQDEVAHYRAVFAALRRRGLDPFVTVNHFTLPVWVHDPIVARPLIQLGLPAPAAGWLSSSTAEEFEKYAAYVAWKYGDQVDNWATLNEPFPPVLTEFLAIPWVVPNWPPGVLRPDLASTFVVNQAIGHVAAYDAIHTWDTTAAAADGPAAFVGFTHNMIPARPANPVNPLDVQAADAWNHFYNKWFPNAVIDGWVDANFDGVKTADEIHPDMAGKVDFLGVQYYGSQPMVGFGVAPLPGFPFLRGFPIRCSGEEPTCSDFNQPTDPGGFREVLELAASYGKPLWVTENGIADADDSKRPSYIVNHVAVVQDLVAHGADIRGYTYWSFVDNLEWSEGYELQFGLYGSDPETPELERIPKPASIAALSGITTANGLPVSLLQTYIPS